MPEAADLGVLGELGTAVGLVDGDGEFEPEWLDDPGKHLGGILSDDGQRQALLDFCDEVLGDPGRSVDADGRVWLPVLTKEKVELCAVIDASADELVAIGAGVRLASSDPDAAGQLQVPIFRVARGAAPRPDSPIFVGRPGARLTASASIRFGEGAEGEGAGLGGIELEFDVPTATDDDPAISLTLLDLKLPGGAPGDLRLSPDGAESLDEVLLELVLGLVRSQAEAAAGPVEALSRLLGLAVGGPVPSLPVAELVTDAAQLGRWLHAVLTEQESRRAWLGALADLLGESASAVEDGVELTIGDAHVRVGIDAGADQGGQPLLVPRLSLLVGDGPRAVLEAELARIAPAAPAAVALPSLSAFAQLGGEQPLLDDDPHVGALRVGISLDAGRRPTLLLALDGVRVAGTELDSLDLSSPGALAEAAGTALDGVAAGLLDGLGAAGEALSQLFGLAAPEHHPSLPKIDAARFLGDPVTALREHWLELLREHEAAIPALLGTACGLLTGAASAAPVEGAGTAEDPWRLPLSGPVELRAVRDPAGALAVSAALSPAAEDIGKGRARVSSEIAISLADLDLAGGSADFLGAIDFSLGVSSKAEREARLDLGDASLRADSIGLAARWSAAAGLGARLDAPNAKLRAGGEEVPAELDGWPTLERLAGLLLSLGEYGLPAELASALGWLGGDGPHLSLAGLAEDAQAALGAWLKQAVEQAEGEATALAGVATSLAATLYASAERAAVAAGGGAPDDPLRLDLGETPSLPLPLAWVEPADASGGRAGQLRLGLRLPVRASHGKLVAAGRLDLDLAGFDVSAKKPALDTGRGLRVVLGVFREGGALVAGPETKLKRLDAELYLPLGEDGGEAEVSIELGGAAALGVSRDSWRVGADDPALPEVRAILSAALADLADLAPVADLLSGLGLLAEGGLDAGALEDLLNDPAHLVATALRSRADDLDAAAEALLANLPGVAVDLVARSVAIDLGPGSSGDGGALAWSARLTATGDGDATATASFGATGEGAAGGFQLRLASSPLQVEAVRHPPGGEPRPIPLWPAADDAALAGLLRDAVPAALVRRGLDLLRDLDAEARPVVDALLAAIGLLGDDGVRFPLGLLADPVGWLGHPGALGGSIDPEKVATLLGALRPVLGAAGSGGRLQPAPGVTIEVTASNGAPRLALSLDGDALGGGELAASLAGALTIGDGAPRVELELGAGLAKSTTARLRVDGDGGPRLVLERPKEAELSLYPDPPGAGDLARSGVEAALPVVLDAIAARGGKGLDGKAAALLGELGDALALRSDGSFDAASLRTLAADPAGELVSRLGELGAAELRALSAALGKVLPSGAQASVAGGRLKLEVAQATLAVRPKPFELTIGGEVDEVPALDSVAASLRFDASELVELSARVGPGAIDAGVATLRPLLAVAAGAKPEGGRHVDLGLGIDGDHSVRARWDLDADELALVAVSADDASEEAGAVALAALAAVGDLAAGLALGAAAVETLLEKKVGAAEKTVRELLAGVLLDTDDPRKAIAGLFETDSLLERAVRLATNAVEAEPRLALEGIEVGLGEVDGRLGLSLAPDGRAPLTSGDVELALEADSRWIAARPPPGLFLGLLKEGELDPRLACDGLGIRVSRSTGPLLDAGISLGSLALHLFAAVDADGVAGGVQLELAGLGVAAGGAEGGNSVGQGMLAGTRGEHGLKPAFSPALAIQGKRGEAVAVSLSAGEGDGPWWQRIQSAFGPLYVEQVGLGVREREDRLERISLLLDARVSLFGLAAAVDDLSLSYDVSGSKSLFDPGGWDVDLAGLAVDGEVAGVSIAGGLRKIEEGKSIQYLGALSGRYSVYGLSLFGGYGQAPARGGGRYTSFFAFGALNAPIGGPPAFFVTGIGGGLGINRELKVPDDVGSVGSSPFIKALDPGGKPDPDPMAALNELATEFPMAEGPFWFAAGVSFTSFALVEGVAVISVAVDEGVEIALLGLARMALPRPEVALASIELGLIARFSTREGVLWVQAQLTDNSWLLSKSVRLTGGFAFVSWFGGPRAGEFVLTLGGYHPSFHRDGYPEVPRLGFNWKVSDAIVIKGESYFALTSEALMVGGRLEASAHFGPAWAEVVFGADGIVYFDPFHFQVDVYASISAGVRIHVWLLGNITISIHIGAHVTLEGPEFHGKAHFEVGPIGLTVAFGGEKSESPRYLPWSEFVVKYLEDAGGGVARVLSAVPGRGRLAPGPTADGKDSPQPDGSPQRPFEVLPEFELTVKSAAPVARLVPEGEPGEGRPMPVDHVLGIAPIHATSLESTLRLELEPVGNASVEGWPERFEIEALEDGRFPLGVWGPPGEQDGKAVPSGEVLRAGEGARIVAAAQLEGRLPAEVPYERVEAGARKPLPLIPEGTARSKLSAAAAPLTAATPTAGSAQAVLAEAHARLAAGGLGKTALAAYAGERSAPPRLGSLADGLAKKPLSTPELKQPTPAEPPKADDSVYPPRALALLVCPAAPTSGGEDGKGGGDGPPLTRSYAAAVAVVAGLGRGGEARRRLAELSDGLQAKDGAQLHGGELAVLEMPNARRDIEAGGPRPSLRSSAPARFAAIGLGGEVLADAVGTEAAIPPATERIAVLDPGSQVGGLLGWHAGQRLAYVGWGVALVAGGTLHVPGGGVSPNRQRLRAGWVEAAELTRSGPVTETRFAAPVRAVAVAVDRDESGGKPHVDLILSGATQVGGDGTPVTVGARTYLVYEVKPQGGPITVTVAHLDGRSLAGVLGAADASPTDVAGRLGREGLDSLMRPLAGPAAKDAQPLSLHWAAPEKAKPTRKGGH